MWFSRFRLINYKGAQDVALQLDSPIVGQSLTTLVGLNESGKTTILNGIDQFEVSSTTDSAPKYTGTWEAPTPDSLIPLSQADNFNDEVQVKATLELEQEDIDAVERAVAADKRYTLVHLERTLFVTKTWRFKDSIYQSTGNLWASTQSSLGTARKSRGRTDYPIRKPHPQTTDLWQLIVETLRDRIPSIWLFPDTLFDFPKQIELVATQGETQTNKLYRELFADILSSVDDDLDTTRHVINRVKSTEEAEGRALRTVEAKLNRELQNNILDKWETIFDREANRKKTIAVKFKRTTAGVAWNIELVEGVSNYSVSERSQGFRWFFVYLLLTTYRGRKSGKRGNHGTLFLFDEPATNLHPAAQERLLGSLNELAGRSQVVYTTHSPHLIHPDRLGSTYVVKNDAFNPGSISLDATADDTNISASKYRQFANEHPDQTHYFQPILDVLDYRPSKLDTTRPLVMFEGKSDYYFFRYFIESEREQKSKLAFGLLPGVGASTLDTTISLYLGWARPFIVMLDADNEGLGQKQRYLDKFGPVLNDRLFVLSDVSGNRRHKTIEDVLHKNDYARVCAVTGKGETKKQFQRGLETACATRQVIGYTQTSKKTVSNMLSKFGALLKQDFGDR